MAKAASPIRLESTLMAAATVTGKVHHRSAAEQIEYWATLGRNVSRVIDPDILLEINAGLIKLSVEKVAAQSVDADAVFAALDNARSSGALTAALASGDVQYQASNHYPGLLEQVHPDGRIVVGQFSNGQFQPHQAPRKAAIR